MRLIDADVLYEETKEYCEKYKITNWTSDDVLEWIVGTSTVDAELVRRVQMFGMRFTFGRLD